MRKEVGPRCIAEILGLWVGLRKAPVYLPLEQPTGIRFLMDRIQQEKNMIDTSCRQFEAMWEGRG